MVVVSGNKPDCASPSGFRAAGTEAGRPCNQPSCSSAPANGVSSFCSSSHLQELNKEQLVSTFVPERAKQAAEAASASQPASCDHRRDAATAQRDDSRHPSTPKSHSRIRAKDSRHEYAGMRQNTSGSQKTRRLHPAAGLRRSRRRSEGMESVNKCNRRPHNTQKRLLYLFPNQVSPSHINENTQAAQIQLALACRVIGRRTKLPGYL
jgi:hypothetical protein